MNRASARRPRRNEILIFGENPNDSRAIKELVEYHRPTSGSSATVRVMRDPVSLTRDAGERAQQSWVDRVRAVVAATEAAGTTIRAVLIHQDADGPDYGPSAEARIERDFSSIGSGVGATPVVPVVMIEAWWFLFPDAVEALKIAWRNSMPRAARNVELIPSPKQELQRRTRARKPQHEYVESDSAAIAAKIRELRLKPSGSAPSYDRFVARVAAI